MKAPFPKTLLPSLGPRKVSFHQLGDFAGCILCLRGTQGKGPVRGLSSTLVKQVYLLVDFFVNILIRADA